MAYGVYEGSLEKEGEQTHLFQVNQRVGDGVLMAMHLAKLECDKLNNKKGI